MAETEIRDDIGLNPETNQIPPKEFNKQRGRLQAQILKFAAPLAGIILAAACSGAESEAPNVAVRTQTVSPTPKAEQTMGAIPSTETPIIDSRTIQKPALTPATAIPAPTEAPMPSPAETATTTSGFKIIKQVIEEIPGNPDQKNEVRAILDRFTQVETVLGLYKQAYESRREQDGTPTLLALTHQKFNRLNEAFPEFILEDQIPFLKDERLLAQILTSLQQKSKEEIVSSVLKSGNEFFNKGIIDGRRRLAYITPETSQAAIEFDTSKTTSSEASKAVETFKTFLKETGLEGKINLKVVLADELSMGNAAGTFSDMERVPEIELAPPFGEKEFFHELTHFLDPDRNSFLYSYLSTKEIIDTLIAIEEALSSEWGRKYPEVNKIFSKDPINAFVKRQNGQPIGPAEFAVVERLNMPAGGWLTPVGDILRNPHESFVDFMSIFDNQFSQDFDKKLENALHGIREEDWSGLVLSQKTLLDELAKRSDWDKALVELLRENATSVTYSPRYHGALSMTHLRRILFFGAAVGGDARVAKLFLNLEPKDRRQILSTFLVIWQNNDKDILAGSTAVTISGKSALGFEWDETLKNPFKTYFYTTISALTS